MLQDDHKKLIKKARDEYRKIGYVECPAFDGEKVYFNRYGFRHLIRKGKKLREIDEQLERLALLKHAEAIIRNSRNFKDFNKNNIGESADFWSLVHYINKTKITVIIRQIKGGHKHFFSIMKG